MILLRPQARHVFLSNATCSFHSKLLIQISTLQEKSVQRIWHCGLNSRSDGIPNISRDLTATIQVWPLSTIFTRLPLRLGQRYWLGSEKLERKCKPLKRKERINWPGLAGGSGTEASTISHNILPAVCVRQVHETGTVSKRRV